MSDFNDFLDKVLAPIRSETQDEAAPAAMVPSPEPASPRYVLAPSFWSHVEKMAGIVYLSLCF